MLVSKSEWISLKKRVADLEQMQGQPIETEISPLEKMKAALREILYQAPYKRDKK